jgi:hypothetical protein
MMRRRAATAFLLVSGLTSCARPSSMTATPESAPAFTPPAGVRWLSRAAWGAKPVLPFARGHTISRLTIHHTGTAQNVARSAADKLAGLQAWSQRDDSLSSGQRKPAWPDVPYHYYVAVDGTVAEGREWKWIGDTNTEYDPTGHLLVVIEGSFDRDTLTTAQRRAMDALVPALARHFRIPAERLATHRDYSGRTTCPGANVTAEIPRWQGLVAGAR